MEKENSDFSSESENFENNLENKTNYDYKNINEESKPEIHLNHNTKDINIKILNKKHINVLDYLYNSILGGPENIIYCFNDLEKKSIFMYIYKHHSRYYKTGEIFGDYKDYNNINLNSNNLENICEINKYKRCYSMISTESCHLGWISKQIYENYFSDLNFKKIIANIEFFLNFQIFKTYEKIDFFTIFYNFVEENKVLAKNEIIIKEGQAIDKIYFLKEGDYVIK